MVVRLQDALCETQEELRCVPWLIGALRYISAGDCAYKYSAEEAREAECTCYPCVARGALFRFVSRQPLPPRQEYGEFEF